MHLCSVWRSSLAVRNKIGRSCPTILRAWRQVSIPSCTGIMMSRSRRHGLRSRSMSIASTPLTTGTTEYPWKRRKSEYILRNLSSSSASRMTPDGTCLVPLCRRPGARDDTKAENGKQLLSMFPRTDSRGHTSNIAWHPMAPPKTLRRGNGPSRRRSHALYRRRARAQGELVSRCGEA